MVNILVWMHVTTGSIAGILVSSVWRVPAAPSNLFLALAGILGKGFMAGKGVR